MKVLRSVKFRLTLSYAFILTLFLSAFALFMREELSRVLYADKDKQLVEESVRLMRPLESYFDGIFLSEPKPASENSRQLLYILPREIRQSLYDRIEAWEKTNRMLSRSTLMVRFVHTNHSLFVSNLKGWEREIIFPNFERDSAFMETGKSFQTIHFQKKPIRLYYQLVEYEGRPLFVLQIGAPIHEIRSTLQRLSLIIGISIPGLVVAACLAGWLLAKRSLRPIDSMIRKAREITMADLKSRLPRTHTGDELDRLADTLNEMLERIENSAKSIRDFSSNISHELKTPLAIIRGEIDLALRRSRSPLDLIQTLRVIEEEVNELIRLVDDLMLLLKSDAKQLRLEKQNQKLEDILQQTADRFRERAAHKNIRLEVFIKQPAAVVGDSLYLKRLFSNLLDNAIKFTPEGGSVTMTQNRTPDNQVRVEVADTGIGIEPELTEKVFIRFFRTDQARAHEGSGLGLNIANAIAEAHGGKIQLKSTPNEGTHVFVFIPLRQSGA
ncbi:MAG: hypothetical protein A2Z83_00600 [Omnitrophica bacterium GWA2_52_8]|nr:MAG: hypothetical protein A2Z83_00600 [Omnitrophica bacterium GWA2_52_8]